MAYSDEQFNQDIETALRVKSGFKGPIVPEAPGEEPATRRSDPGYAARQAALARPRMMAQGQDMESILGLDRYIFEKEKANIGGERAMANWDTRMKAREVREQAREEANLARQMGAAKIEKTQAEAEKARGEAIEARLKYQPGVVKPKTDLDVVLMATPRVAGESDEAWGQRLKRAQAEQAGAKAGAIEGGRLQQPLAITPKEQAEGRERSIRINQTRAALSPEVWDKAITGLTAPGLFTGAFSNLAERTGMLPPEQTTLYTVIDKLGMKERHENFGANFTPTEQTIARAIIPNRYMHPNKLRAVLEMNMLVDEWAEAFEVEMAGLPRNSAVRKAREQIFRKTYPVPVTQAQGKAYQASAQERAQGTPPPALRKVGDTMTFPNGNVGVWDGQSWVKQ